MNRVPLFELRDAAVISPTGTPIFRIDLAVRNHAVTAILGPGGTGKSLLLRAFAGAGLPPGFSRTGTWRFRGQPFPVSGLPDSSAVRLVAQVPTRARGAAEGVPDWRAALDSGANTVLLDEPDAAGDDHRTAELVARLREHTVRGAAIVVTHNVTFARLIADDVALLCAGTLAAACDGKRFFSDPPGELAQRFVRQGNCWPGAAPSLPNHFNWIVPDRLAGLGAPGLTRDIGEDLRSLAAVGISTLVSLTRQPPASNLLRDHAIQGRHFPIRDMDVPPLASTARLCRDIVRAMNNGEAVAVHCRAGLGRTGTILAATLVWTGVAPVDAISRLRAIVPGFIQNRAQEQFVHRFAESIGHGKSGSVPDA